MIKKVIALVVVCTLILTACAPQVVEQGDLSQEPSVSKNQEKDEASSSSASISSQEDVIIQAEQPTFDRLSDPDLLTYLENDVYAQLVKEYDSDEYFIENVSAIYISKEYLEELAFNSQENIFFGYTLSEVHEQFGEESFIFTLDESNQTVIRKFEEYDDTYEQIIQNVAVGTGVILLCVTVASATTVTAPAVSLILTVSAKTGAIGALSSGAIGGTIAGITKGIETQNFDEAIKSAALVGSDSFKWGAVTGVLTGGIAQASALKGATLNGLTMDEAAIIQRESVYPLNVIKQFNSMDEYIALKNASVSTHTVNGNVALIQKIDLNYIDEFGNTNLQRMLNGKAPLDPSGTPYQLHHIGQNNDASLAILTQKEHAQIPNLVNKSSIDRTTFNTIRKNFWKDYGQQILDGVL